MRPTDATIEFNWELRIDGQHIADIGCQATAKVFGDYEVGAPSEIEVWTGEKYIPADWLGPHIRAYLLNGAEDDLFIEAARHEGRIDHDARRDLLAAQ